ncbi:MAG: hypothetical protein UU48_C0009G0017 [Candidatus Uhrbacteria bacterium GW2011_GWF2_41_16]|jgi:hypothetical protein|uniref:Uncharacterized protein n=2 Tax=Candidatus Uhriibacteriota TaxID=1752732 RepID=A0A0G0XLS8_9BACT|nr:MAG: hypothetical protein UU35_C0011G0015 [Candidatus Uhrbacteria bacterium GW2011_GWC2_41_11]KKR97745.1 MAG: hypothetical protein UU48_C0009G0017 [Candidatus Uhrbacteria bacterium GW2011_GWF2_41_16]HBO99753.1 hypothetical protein [Candidatus Uhrbacteria bacterium]
MRKSFLIPISFLIIAFFGGMIGFFIASKPSPVKDELFSEFIKTQKNVSIVVPVVNKEKDGVHFEGGTPETVAWGPKTYSVGTDGTIWIDDTPAMRKIHVDIGGNILEVQPYTYGNQPKETFSENQKLSPQLEETRIRLTQKTLYEGFIVSSSETHYWGTSPEGFQYWQTVETREDVGGMLRVHTFLHVTDVSGITFAIAELPTSSQFTQSFNGGIFVDPERNATYFMATSPTGVQIQSVDWMKISK